jgi:hypothetical protein
VDKPILAIDGEATFTLMKCVNQWAPKSEPMIARMRRSRRPTIENWFLARRNANMQSDARASRNIPMVKALADMVLMTTGTQPKRKTVIPASKNFSVLITDFLTLSSNSKCGPEQESLKLR